MDGPLISGPADVAARASSVLKGNARQFGPARMFDGCPDTCWNSDGVPAGGGGAGGQWVELELKRGPAVVTAVEVTFQGGFVGQECAVSVRPAGGGEWLRVAEFEPDDTNAPQRVPLPPCAGGAAGVAALRLDFGRSTDFFGRVTVYRLDLFGHYLPAGDLAGQGAAAAAAAAPAQ